MEEQKFQERRKVKDNNQQSENSLACARVVCHTEHTHTGIVNTYSVSDHARVRARAIPANFVAAWRERIFADGVEDPQACSRDGKHVSDDLPEPPLPPRPAEVDT